MSPVLHRNKPYPANRLSQYPLSSQTSRQRGLAGRQGCGSAARGGAAPCSASAHYPSAPRSPPEPLAHYPERRAHTPLVPCSAAGCCLAGDCPRSPRRGDDDGRGAEPRQTAGSQVFLRPCFGLWPYVVKLPVLALFLCLFLD
jgi:hypothetical protein